MQIDAYFEQIRRTVDNCPFVRSSSILTDDRATFQGFVRGDLVFIDHTCLHWREFVNVQSGLLQLMYSFQYMDTQGRLIFRYDNADHHVAVATFPHHKHEGTQKNVIPSSAPTLADLLEEIGRMIQT